MPRTIRLSLSTLTNETMLDAIGLGRTGERSEQVPRTFPSLAGLCITGSRRES